MIKYSEHDIRDGITRLKIGIHNIMYALNEGSISEKVIPLKINLFILVGVLQELLPGVDISYKDSGIVVQNKINIDIHENATTFYV